MVAERKFSLWSAYLMLFVSLANLAGAIYIIRKAAILDDAGYAWLGVFVAVVFLVCLTGYFVVNPNESRVMILFGTYKGTVKEFGFHWANPFMIAKNVSLRLRNLNGEKLKVNDAVGNPIEIAAVIVWKVEDTSKAVFAVDDYVKFVTIQSEAAVRSLAGSYPYDNFEDEHASITLRAGAEKINEVLEEQLSERLEKAGVKVMEARISHLAYAPEIAGAMLQRQQASAVVAARQKIVEGAVGMVEMALDMIKEKQIIELNGEKKAEMVSNLLVVLTSDRSVHPVINTGQNI